MFAELINAVAKLSQDEDRGPYRSRPSMAGPEKCIRSMVYAAVGAKAKPFPGRSILTMNDSSWHEELTFDWASQTVLNVHSRQMPVDIPVSGLNPEGFYCSVCEQEIAPGLLHGHLDAIVQDPLGRDWMWEHKAFTEIGYSRLEKELPLDNLAQSACYSRGVQLLQPGLDRVLLTVKNKNHAQYMDFECTYEMEADVMVVHKRIRSNGDLPAIVETLNHRIEGIFAATVAKFMEVDRYAAKKTLPKRPYPFGTNFPCGWCLYAGMCWEGYEGEVNALSSDVALNQEAADAVRFERELRADMGRIKKQREEVQASLLKMLETAGAKSGRAGEYLLEWVIEHKSYVIKSMVPPNAYEKRPSERLKISKIKDPDSFKDDGGDEG